MIDNTINDDKTIAGGGEGAVLAGRYHILMLAGARRHGGGNVQRENGIIGGIMNVRMADVAA